LKKSQPLSKDKQANNSTKYVTLKKGCDNLSVLRVVATSESLPTNALEVSQEPTKSASRQVRRRSDRQSTKVCSRL